MDSITRLETTALVVAAFLAMLINLLLLLKTIFYTDCLELRHPSNRGADLLHQYRWTYLTLLIVGPVIITAIQATFLALSWNKWDYWPFYLTSSIIISSILVEVRSPGLTSDRVDHS